MFKTEKDVNTRSHNALSKKDVKKLAQSVQSAFTVTEEDMARLLPPKAELIVMKLASKALLYFDASQAPPQPIFFDSNGRNSLYPTVYALWRCPDMVPTVLTHPAVSKPLCNGADLMLPGVVNAAASVAALPLGSKCCVKVRGNAMAVAVGETSVDAEHIEKHGTAQGIAVTVYHSYMDSLWAMSGTVPNEGFQKGLVLPTESLEEEDEEDTDEEDSSDAAGEGESAAEEEAVPSEALLDGLEGMALQEEGITLHGEEGEGQADEEGEEAEQKAIPEVDGSSMSQDELLEFSFMMAIKKSVKDSKLPMLVSEFFAQHMLLCRPVGSTLDIKKSSYKKIGKFLQAMATDRRIRMLDEKGNLSLQAINRSHPAYKEFRTGVATERDTARAEAAVIAEESATQSCSVREAYRFSAALRPLLPEDFDLDTYWAHAEASQP